MSLTIRYLDLSHEDVAYLRNALGGYEVYFNRVGNATTLTASGDMSDMLAILKVTSKYQHQSFMLRQ